MTAISLDAIPRTLSAAPRRWTPFSSQANVGGYKAVLIAANAYGRYFPLLTTAAGTAKPANVLILGIGVAGLQAIGTARRLGAVVKAYDVRPETREQAESLGAQFVKLKTTIDATGAGGYARELTAEERAAQQAELNEVDRRHGRRDHDRPGPGPQAAGPRHRGRGRADEAGLGHRRHGGVRARRQLRAVARPARPIVTDNGVTIIAPDNLPATMPAGASAFYARNISALLLGMVKDGELNLDFEDEVTSRPSSPTAARSSPRPSKKLLEPAPAAGAPEAPHEPRGRRSAHALTVFVLAILVRLRRHQQGPGDPPHAADVGRELDPRHRPRRLDVHRRSARPTR